MYKTVFTLALFTTFVAGCDCTEMPNLDIEGANDLCVADFPTHEDVDDTGMHNPDEEPNSNDESSTPDPSGTKLCEVRIEWDAPGNDEDIEFDVEIIPADEAYVTYQGTHSSDPTWSFDGEFYYGARAVIEVNLDPNIDYKMRYNAHASSGDAICSDMELAGDAKVTLLCGSTPWYQPAYAHIAPEGGCDVEVPNLYPI